MLAALIGLTLEPWLEDVPFIRSVWCQSVLMTDATESGGVDDAVSAKA
jgi:hypothetical protein